MLNNAQRSCLLVCTLFELYIDMHAYMRKIPVDISGNKGKAKTVVEVRRIFFYFPVNRVYDIVTSKRFEIEI